MFTGCVPPRVDNGGHRDASRLSEFVEPGKTVKGDIRNKMGSPSLTSQFGQDTWYYVSEVKEAVAFLEPEVTRQQVTRIVFDEEGVVAEIETYDRDDARNVAIAEDRTPTAGEELNFLEQILGNVGRFNPGQQGGASAPGGRGRGVPGP